MGRENDRGPTSSARPSSPAKRRHIGAALLLLIGTLWLIHSDTIPFYNDGYTNNAPGSPHHTDLFDWNDVQTKPHLSYTPCYGRLQCARLELPMDWFNGTTNASISLAVVRQPAAVPVTHPQYGGAILLNPGGPGGSGVGLVLGFGEYARSIVDTNTTDGTGKYFDIMSFDPRGVFYSRPRVDCFHDPFFALSWQQRVQEEGWFESSDAALGRLWSFSTAKGHGCSNVSRFDGDDIKKYVSTASAARDMLELVEKHGEWREKEAASLMHQHTASVWTRPLRGCMSASKVPVQLRYKPGKEKIQYYGVSYGSYLGGTFAAMFPDRVGRLAVDGVVEYTNYMSANWSSNLIDTEKTMDSFYFHCARAGYPACVLADENGPTNASHIKRRTSDIVQSLYHNPLPVYTPSADVLSYSEVKSLIFGALYSPVLVFPLLAQFLLAIEQRNSTVLAPLVQVLHVTACGENPAVVGADAQIAIACSDGDDQSFLSRSDFAAFAEELRTQSPTSGSIWSTIRMNCVHYTQPAVHRFRGPWKANTRHPLLFIGNTADPVTPGLYAREMAKGFEGAVALMQDSGGHCSASAFSLCTQGYVRKYFQTGELPPKGAMCQPDVVPFGPTPGELVVESAELRAAREKWEEVADILVERQAWVPGRNNVWRDLRKAVMDL